MVLWGLRCLGWHLPVLMHCRSKIFSGKCWPEVRGGDTLRATLSQWGGSQWMNVGTPPVPQAGILGNVLPSSEVLWNKHLSPIAATSTRILCGFPSLHDSPSHSLLLPKIKLPTPRNSLVVHWLGFWAYMDLYLISIVRELRPWKLLASIKTF